MNIFTLKSNLTRITLINPPGEKSKRYRPDGTFKEKKS